MHARAHWTPRERWLETVLFGRPDKVPFEPGQPRESTVAAWHAQGLPEGADWSETMCRQIGIQCPRAAQQAQHGVSFRMIPEFEERILAHRDGHYIVQDWKGNICEISDRYGMRHLREALDFVTRRWIKLPVEKHEHWAAMKRRYNPFEPARFPDDFTSRCQQLRKRDYVSTVFFPGPFWQLREWLGFERLCILFIDDPEWLAEMVEFWTEFVSRTMAPVLEAGVVDRLLVSEDMAYKQKSMISPAMARQFLLPSYSRWAGEARQAGVPVIEMDSDGCVNELIPVWLESGLNVVSPVEVAAGNDIAALRQQFGHRMAYRQGVDKRAMAKGGVAIEAELARLAPVLHDGGYIPGCDHAVPPDVSWPDYLRYARLLAELTGWA